ncbi:unnamed protein product [Effrenium voratum]|nr:unnamed protein product [Effrenium voratum]
MATCEARLASLWHPSWRLLTREERLRRRMEVEEQQQTRSATPRASPAQELRAAQLGAEAAALREELLASEEVAAWSRKHAVQLEAELEQCRRELAECKEQQALEASRRTRPGQSSSKSRQAAWQAAPALSEESWRPWPPGMPQPGQRCPVRSPRWLTGRHGSRRS